MEETTATGLEAVALASALLGRVRSLDPLAGVWESADPQWWWRKPRASDTVEQVFWTQDGAPVAGAYLTAWTEDGWQCDVLRVPGLSAADLELVWQRAREQVVRHATGRVDVPIAEHDAELLALAREAGLEAGERSSVAWLDAATRPAPRAVADGFTIVDRTQRLTASHPMVPRNGDGIAERLAQCPLYDPGLDLSVETADGRVTGYTLTWLDPATGTGLVEPVRVEDGFARRGLASAMVSEGVERLAARGARRVKIGYGSEAARGVYEGVGFVTTSVDTWYSGAVDALR